MNRWTKAALAACLTLPLAPRARAFCGAYVGGATTNTASIVVVARQGRRTTLTLVNDYGDAEGSFGYVMPVPATLGLDDVATVDPDVITRLDAYSAPRVVAYDCEDVVWRWVYDTGSGGGHWVGDPGGTSGGCGGGGGSSPDFAGDSGRDTAGGRSLGGAELKGAGAIEEVEVTERATVGAYDLALVGATGGAGLGAWLDQEGFAVDATTGDRLQHYVDQGLAFLVARVDLDELPGDRRWLPPLRLSYDADVVSLPIWLGAASSSGEQDLLIFGLTDLAPSGALAISSSSDHRIDSECMVEDVDGYLAARWGEILAEDSRVPWVPEFGWPSGKCDPCANGAQLSDQDVAAVGFQGPAADSFFSRLHLRYRPEQVREDVVLYESGIVDRWQLRFVAAAPEMADFFPACEGTEVAGEGACEPPEDPAGDTGHLADAADADDGGGALCSGVGVAFFCLGLGWAGRRRRG